MRHSIFSIPVILTLATLSACSQNNEDTNKQDTGNVEASAQEETASSQPAAKSEENTGAQANVSESTPPPATPTQANSASSAAASAQIDTASPSQNNADKTPVAEADSTAKATAQVSHNWVMDKNGSSLQFTGTQTGTEFVGTFEKFDSKITLDPANLASSSITVTIDMASAKTGDRQRDDAIPGKDWFDVKAHPTATFKSTNITRIDGTAQDGNYAAAGTLKIRDIVKEVSLPFTLTIENDSAVAIGALSLQRNGFGVGQGEWANDDWVKYDVGVNFTIKATREK